MLGPELGNWISRAPTVAGLLIASLLLGLLWMVCDRLLRKRLPLPSFSIPIVRLLIGTACLWFLFRALGQLVVFGTNWPLLFWAAIGAAATELIVWLFALEAGCVAPPLARRLLCLRLGALGLVLLVLLEPLWAIHGERRVDKTVVVLLDDSESMHLQDDGWSQSERLDIAGLFDPRSIAGRPTQAAGLRQLEDARAGIAAALASANAVDARHWIRELATNQLLSEPDRDAARQALDALATPNPATTTALLRRLDERLETLPAEVEQIDATWLAERTPSGTRRDRIDTLSARTRSEIARRVLVHGKRPLLRQLEDTYNVAAFSIAVAPRRLDVDALGSGQLATGFEDTKAAEEDTATSPSEPTDRGGTDLTAALRHVLRTIPPEELGGVLLLSDGRHNGADAVELPGAQFAGRGIPVHSVLLGTKLGLRDASIARLESPETVFLGEEMVVQAELSFSGLRGESAKIELLLEGTVVDQRVLPVADQRERQNILFAHKTDTEGVVEYTLRIAELDGERFASNNERLFEVAVSDDRTNVLLVDAKPRWEFRYLRNLFYGRDAAIHFQYVLLDPDHITGETKTRQVYASADREYGDAEATALPKSRADWLKFDVIILGDIPPEALDRDTIDTIHHAVTKRGAMLVVSCGQNHMPHGYNATAFRELLPVRITDGLRTAVAPEPGFRLTLTTVGRAHPIMQQSEVAAENERIWAKQPPFFWRHPGLQAAGDAEILAYAERSDPMNGRLLDPSLNGKDINMKRLRRARQLVRPLVVTRRTGRGNVVVVTTDQTWRLRHKAGDIYHHKFWGQLLQWGAGERLRAGNDKVRLGTDKLVYTPEESVTVTAKVIDEALLPAEDEVLEVRIALEGKPAAFRKHLMTFRENSAGMFEAILPALGQNGRYRVTLPTKDRTGDTGEPIETTITVAGGQMSVELSELSADPATLQRLADLSGGRVFGPDDALEASELFGDAREIIPERRDISLWDRWPVFLAFLALVGTEWISRRRASLP